jgi:L-cystine transport system permease protein
VAESIWKTLFIQIAQGIPMTLLLSFLPLTLSIVPGLYLAILRYRRRFVGGRIAAAYITFFRSVPIVLQILFIYSWLPSALASLMRDDRSRQAVFAISPLWYALFLLTLNAIALTGEAFRGALFAIPTGQEEAARACGFSPRAAFLRVIWPQTLTLAMPNLANAAVVMIRQSALAFLMTVPEMTSRARQVSGVTFAYVESYAVLLCFYILLCFLSDRLFGFLAGRRSVYLGPDRTGKKMFCGALPLEGGADGR